MPCNSVPTKLKIVCCIMHGEVVRLVGSPHTAEDSSIA